MCPLSNFPEDKPFEKLTPDTPLSEIALRIVVNFYSDSPYIIGTATVLCGNLLVTAKHVLEDVYKPMLKTAEHVDEENHLMAIQLLPGPEYVLWSIVEAIACPIEDILLLRTAKTPATSNPTLAIRWKQPKVNPFSPPVGNRVAAFGYRLGKAEASKNADGGHHVNLNDEPIMSVGVVEEVHDWKRDNYLLPFPCYRVSARFDGGMSGGPVFEETGALCGIVCNGMAGAHDDGTPISYVSMLWPLFRLVLDWNRGDKYPQGTQYPAIELALGGQIVVTDLSRLEKWFHNYLGLPPNN